MKRKLESMEDLLQAVEYYGFLPFFPNDIPGFSVEEMCAPAYWFAEDRDGPWEWKGPAAQTKRCAYGKFFRKKAGFVSWRSLRKTGGRTLGSEACILFHDRWIPA